MWERKVRAGLGGQKAAQALSETTMPRDIAKAMKRARKMTPTQCTEWADGALAAIGRNLLDHSRYPSGDYLRAAQSDAAVLYAVLTAATTHLPAAEPLDRLPSADLGVSTVRSG